MSLDADARSILAEYEHLASAGVMESRRNLIHATGLGWGRFLEAHHYMVNNLLVPSKLNGRPPGSALAIRYDARTRLWTAGAERHNGAAGYDESKDYIRWHGRYLATRLTTSDAHLEAINQAFPAKRRTLRPAALHRYLQNALAELEDALAAL